MKNLLKNPLFYTNILLAALVVVLAANTPAVQAKISLVKKAFAANIIGSGTVNFLARFAGAANPSGEIGDSLIFDDNAGHIAITQGTDPGALDSKVEILSGADRILELIRTGATSPTVFRMGTDGALIVSNANTDVLTAKNGFVGIGTANPVYKLEVNAGSDSALLLRSDRTNNEIIKFTTTAGAEKFHIRDTGGAYFGGNTGIGMMPEAFTGPTKLYVGGNVTLPIPGNYLYINGKLYLQEQSSDPGPLVNGMIWMRY